MLDFGRLLPAAIATAELSRHGAEVVKVESPPFGDYLRAEPPLVSGFGDMHLQANRGKRSVGLALAHPDARWVVADLVAASDVVVVSARPASLGRLGLDYDAVASVNPSVVHCALSGFGTTGPYSNLGAHGLSADAAAGLVGPEINDDGGWSSPYISVGPRAAGLYAASAVMAALVGVARGGTGLSLEVSQHEAALAWGARGAVLAANQAGPVPRYSTLGHRMRAYATADGSWVLFGAVEPRSWRRFAEAAGTPDLLDSAASDDAPLSFDDDPRLGEALVELFATRTTSEWLELAAGEGLPVTPFVPAEQLVDDPHVRARGVFETVELPCGGEAVVVSHPVVVDGARPGSEGLCEMGADTRSVLAEIGYGDAQVDDLVARGVVTGPSVSPEDGKGVRGERP